jgi:hypothetical protein
MTLGIPFDFGGEGSFTLPLLLLTCPLWFVFSTSSLDRSKRENESALSFLGEDFSVLVAACMNAAFPPPKNRGNIGVPDSNRD